MRVKIIQGGGVLKYTDISGIQNIFYFEKLYPMWFGLLIAMDIYIFGINGLSKK